MRVLALTRKSLEERPVDKWLNEIPTSDIAVITARKGSSYPPDDVRTKFCAYHEVDDYSSWEVERIVAETAHRISAERIISSSEDDVIRAARARSFLGMSGQTLESATAFRDKLRMKQIVASAEVPTPSYVAVTDPLRLEDFSRGRSAVVVKPRLGGGSASVTVLRSHHERRRWLSDAENLCSDEPQWIAEEFVDAPFFHIDGLMADRGAVLFAWPTQYSSGNFEALQDRTPLSGLIVSPDRAEHAALMTLTERVLSVLPSPDHPMSFHLEAWVHRDRGPLFCEVACRTGGGYVRQLHRRAFGVDLSRENLRGQAGLAVTSGAASVDRAHCGLVFPVETGQFSAPSSPHGIEGVDLVVTGRSGTHYSAEGAHAGDNVACATIEGPDDTTVVARRDALIDWWTSQAVWS